MRMNDPYNTVLSFLKDNPQGLRVIEIANHFRMGSNTANSYLTYLKRTNKARNEPIDQNRKDKGAPKIWFAAEKKEELTAFQVLTMPFVPSQGEFING